MKTATKWVALFIAVTLYLALIIFLAKMFLFDRRGDVQPVYHYDSGKSNTTYDPGKVDDLIKNIDTLADSISKYRSARK